MSTMTINGKLAPLPDDPDALLVDVVRDALDLTGTKLVCGAGVCGACTVLVDGVPAVSCLMPARSAANKNVTTVEGIGAAKLHPVQKAFMAHDALQCGFCTPGFIVEAAAFHDRWRATKGTAAPSREEIGAALSGHLCRCGAYDGIFRAVADACAGRFDGDDILPPRMEARDKVTGSAKYTVDIHHDGQLEGVILRSPVRACAHQRTRSGVGARDAGRECCDLAARRRPHRPLCRRTHRRRRGQGSQDRAGRDRRHQARQRTPAVGDRARRSAQGRCAGRVRKIRAQEGRQRLRRRRLAGALERQYPRTVGGVLQEAEEGAELGRRRARGEQSAAGRGHLPHRHATACLPRAACCGRAFRWRPADRACFDAVGVSCDGADRQALQARPRQGARDCRPCRRRFWFEGSAWRGNDHRDRTGARSQGAGQGRLRPARGAFGDGLSAGDGSENRPAAVRARRTESTFTHRLRRHGRRDQFDHRGTCPPDLSGGSKRTRRFRRHQQFAGRRSLPRPRRAADGVRAGTGDRRSGAAHEHRSDRAAQTLGSRSQPATAVRLGLKPGGLAQPQTDRRAERPLSPRRRRRHRLLALSVAARLEGRSGGQGRTPDRQQRDAGHRHRHPHRDRQYGRARIRAGAA